MVPDAARARLEAEIAAAEADVTRVRAENAELADAFRAEPSDTGKEGLKRAAASLAAARDRVQAGKAALDMLERTGSEHGLVAAEGKVMGSITISVPAGVSREERERVIEEALSAELTRVASDLGATLGATPSRYTRERSGRDAQGRTVLDVAGRVEGDVLLPAITRAAKLAGR